MVKTVVQPFECAPQARWSWCDVMTRRGHEPVQYAYGHGTSRKDHPNDFQKSPGSRRLKGQSCTVFDAMLENFFKTLQARAREHDDRHPRSFAGFTCQLQSGLRHANA